ncbi:putative centromere DNA-binding CBF3-like domain-containing protein [Phytophthora infestans]|uniref:Putative centromere DNA-binding CBF3-like domain-containing protein n=1 Tax=Phytophthora infestans TaxID=4787 RepID=A0A833T2Q5_PHYIN|nr:putative centromere DNA-binding CBF3-like domain-containing protein [Phytophthora infestans]
MEGAYTIKQAEYKQWCDDKGDAFRDLTKYIVTGAKLDLCPKETVIGRAKRNNRRKEDNVQEQQASGEGEIQSARAEMIGKAVVNGYIAAIVDLWQATAEALWGQ